MSPALVGLGMAGQAGTTTDAHHLPSLGLPAIPLGSHRSLRSGFPAGAAGQQMGNRGWGVPKPDSPVTGGRGWRVTELGASVAMHTSE